MLRIRDVLDVVLQDDDTPYGGVSFEGETVDDFLFEDINDTDYREITINSPVTKLNKILKECGIRPIDRREKLWRKLALNKETNISN